MYSFSLKKLTKKQKHLRKRILEISHASRFAHLGSCFSAIDLIDAVYDVKKKSEKFILSNGHAGIAWYVVLEKHGYLTEEQIKKLHVHPDRNLNHDIHVSTGSLGQGLPIAVGLALANKKENVYCMLSDGECTEGSIWEALCIARENNLTNLKIIINANGWSAYNSVDLPYLMKRIKAFGYHVKKVNGHDKYSLKKQLSLTSKDKPTVYFAYTVVEQFPFLQGLDAHYFVMQEENYKLAIQSLL